MTKHPTLPLGTISEGTCRQEDIIPALLYFAHQVKMSRNDRQTVRECARDFHRFVGATPQTFGSVTLSDLSEVQDELIRVLENYVPEYCYLGTLDGDGAHLGVWASIPDADEVPRGNELPSKPIDGFRYFLVVSDHGNCTLYHWRGRQWQEVWGIV